LHKSRSCELGTGRRGTTIATRLAKLLLLTAVITLTTRGHVDDSLLKKAREKLAVLPTTLADLPALKDNPLTPAKIELGKMLFFDPRLSSSWTISCHSCHNLALGGVDHLETSIGHGWRKGGRNSPTIYNSVLNVAQFWDGRAKTLRDQAKGPIETAVEMNNSPARVMETLKSIPGYVEQFTKAFPGETDSITFDNLAKAIEAFEATLLTPNSRFDEYLKGAETAINEQEKRGLALFIAKDCVSCHYGPNIGGARFQKFGAVRKPPPDIMPPADKGLLVLTGIATDEYVFRVPSLRNVELTAPYFHSGAVRDLKQAVATMAAVQLDAKLKDGEIEDLTALLKTFTGKIPRLEYPVLPPHTSQTPPPDTGPDKR
jgi:cytochrome c peroxidase